MTRSVQWVAGCLAVVGFFQAQSRAESLTFEAELKGGAKTATVAVISRQGVDYVSLTQLVEQFGGGYNVLPRRTSLDFAGTKAWVQVDDNRVNALKIFSLVNPIQRVNDDMLIGKTDVPAFFGDAFNVPVRSLESSIPSPTTLEPLEPGEQAGTEPAGAQGVLGRVAAPQTAAAVDRPIAVVVIDAGHGGNDTGLAGASGALEKDIALAIALQLQQMLADIPGREIVMTRSGDSDLSIQDRALAAANAQGDLIVSIHVGGSASPTIAGTALYFPQSPSTRPTPISRMAGEPDDVVPNLSPQSEAIAKSIGQGIAEATGKALRGILAAPLRIAKEAGVPSVLIEVGCITNPAEEAALLSEDGIQNTAKGIAFGLKLYLSTASPPAPADVEPIDAVEPE